MKQCWTLCGALGAFAILSACADGASVAPAAMNPAGSVLSELPMQDLARGQCALVLWAQRSPPQRLLVTLDRPAVARITVEGKTIELARVSQSGEPLFGQFPLTRYRGDGLTLGVSFTADNARGAGDGARISSAVVEYIDDKGWTTIIPAAGLIGCQT